MIAFFLAAVLNVIPIAAARHLAQGTTVTVVGVVTVPSGRFSSSSGDQGFALRDQTGGIWVSVKENPHLPAGRCVQVTGALGTNAGKLQVAATEVTRLAGTALRVPTGQVGTATLGHIITIEGTITGDVAGDLPYGYKLFVDDGSGAAQVYINTSTGIDPRASHLRRGKRLRVTGFGSQYETTYEVEPRDRRDLVPLP